MKSCFLSTPASKAQVEQWCVDTCTHMYLKVTAAERVELNGNVEEASNYIPSSGHKTQPAADI